MLVGSVQEDARSLLVARIEFNDRDPDAVYTTQLRLKAAGIRMLPNARSFLAYGIGDSGDGQLDLARNACGVEPS